MTASTHHFIRQSTGLRYLVFALGLMLLLFSWFVLYELMSLKTEALLAPWQDGCRWYTCPALGTVPRTINDFFTGFGRDLPSIIFVLVCGGIFAMRARQSKDRAWLPLVFFLANVVFVAADLLAISLSWSLSDRVVGPRMGIDAGYHRTWYGIAATCILWVMFWILLLKLPVEGREKLAKLGPTASTS